MRGTSDCNCFLTVENSTTPTIYTTSESGGTWTTLSIPATYTSASTILQ